jgi:hypothetical protein
MTTNNKIVKKLTRSAALKAAYNNARRRLKRAEKRSEEARAAYRAATRAADEAEDKVFELLDELKFQMKAVGKAKPSKSKDEMLAACCVEEMSMSTLAADKVVAKFLSSTCVFDARENPSDIQYENASENKLSGCRLATR